MKVHFTDRAELADVQELPNGRLVVNARVARGGNIQEYLGSEVGKPGMSRVRVYRPEDEVFNVDSVKTFPHKIVTLDHPAGPADFERDAVGWIGDEVMRDGEFIRVPMTVAAKRAVDAVKGGKRELSVGYTSDIEFTSGTSPTGGQYDAIMKNITVDHVAIVSRARGGPELRLGDWRSLDDNNPAPMEITAMTELRKVVVDGLTIDATPQSAEVITKLQNEIERLKTGHAQEIAAKDAEIAKKDGEIDGLRGKVLDDAAIDRRVTERSDLIAKARRIYADVKTDGLADEDIRKAVVAAKLGDSAVDGKSAAYIEARFDILADEANETDRTRENIAGRPVHTVGDDQKAANDAHAAYVARLTGKKGAA